MTSQQARKSENFQVVTIVVLVPNALSVDPQYADILAIGNFGMGDNVEYVESLGHCFGSVTHAEASLTRKMVHQETFTTTIFAYRNHDGYLPFNRPKESLGSWLDLGF